MKVGSLVYATQQGLGILAKSFYEHGVITDVLVVKHSSRWTHHEWYPLAGSIPIRPFNTQKAQEFCAAMDVMFFFETPFDWNLIEFCRTKKVKTVLMPMYECMPTDHPQADLTICPSLLDLQYYKTGVFIPVPVEVEWKQRKQARVFVHNSGHGGLRGRNGTRELCEAMKLVKSPIQLLIRTQDEIRRDTITRKLYEEVQQDKRVFWSSGGLPFEELYNAGDVFVFPERFNGLSLPLQEARASGMLIMATNRFPMNTWLPPMALIKESASYRARISPRCFEFNESIIEPKDIAAKIDEFYNQDISAYSLSGKEWAKTMSWEVLKPQYIHAIESL